MSDSEDYNYDDGFEGRRFSPRTARRYRYNLARSQELSSRQDEEEVENLRDQVAQLQNQLRTLQRRYRDLQYRYNTGHRITQAQYNAFHDWQVGIRRRRFNLDRNN